MQPLSPASSSNITKLITLEKAVRQAESLHSLMFVIVNRTREVVPYEQAVLLTNISSKKPKVQAIGNIATVDRNTPFVQWLERMASREIKLSTRTNQHDLSRESLKEYDKTDWNEFSPPHIRWVPLISPQKGFLGILWLAKAEPWSEKETVLLNHLSLSYAHALQFFLLPWSFRASVMNIVKKPALLSLPALILILYLVQVPLTGIAPVEVAATAPAVVSSPMDGVVSEILVHPNQRINPGQPIVLLDATDLNNQVAIAREALEVAEVQLEKAERGAFQNSQNRGVLAELSAQVELRKSELQYITKRLEKTKIVSEKSGIAVISDPEGWAGKPVHLGEKIMQIADPKKVELKIMLPVSDAIFLKAGNRVRIFLDSSPLDAKEAQITHSEYDAYKTETGVLSYRVTAKFIKNTEQPRIGLRGTAKVFGEKVPLLYYFFRKPFTAIRQRMGW